MVWCREGAVCVVHRLQIDGKTKAMFVCGPHIRPWVELGFTAESFAVEEGRFGDTIT